MTSIGKNTSPLEIAAIISEALGQADITAVLSGGAAVSIYSKNRYESRHLDFVTSERISELEAALAPLGFVKGEDRYFEHPKSNYFIEFPPGPVAVGSLVITEWKQLATEYGVIQILSPTQMVMDRLAAYIHWSDQPSLDQAVWIAQENPIEWQALESWIEAEGGAEQYEVFQRAVQRDRNINQTPDAM